MLNQVPVLHPKETNAEKECEKHLLSLAFLLLRCFVLFFRGREERDLPKTREISTVTSEKGNVGKATPSNRGLMNQKDWE